MTDQLIKLKNRAVQPPVGWSYKDSDTNFLIEGGHFDQLVEMVSKHRAANGLSIAPNLPAIIEDAICRQIPAEMTNAPMSDYPVSHRPMTLSTVTNATKIALKAWRRLGRHVVPKSKANERAKLCTDCPENVMSSACLSCKGLSSWIREWLGRSTPYDDSLYVCRVCGVMSSAQIHLTRKTFADYSSEAIIPKHPESCWKRKLLEA